MVVSNMFQVLVREGGSSADSGERGDECPVDDTDGVELGELGAATGARALGEGGTEPEGDAPVGGPVSKEGEARARRDAVMGLRLGGLPPWLRRRKRQKLMGDLAAHARFLQAWFRRARRVRSGCWGQRGGLRRLCFYRRNPVPACMDGRNLAGLDEFEAQRERFRQASAWYFNYVRLLKARSSGRTPSAVVTFCKQGGVSEGIRRGGGAVHGQDLTEQPRYRARFGQDSFTQGDSTCTAVVADLKRRAQAFLVVASPPCKEASSSRMRGEPSEPAMIKETRSVLDASKEISQSNAISPR